MIPGELFTDAGEHELNPGRRSVTLVVENSGDRPIQVGSHYHFAETNAALRFDRAAAHGMRLAIAASFALFHGFAHGQELSGPFGAWALAGMVSATALLHASGIALGLATKRSPVWLPRVAGAGVALFGASLLLAA